MRWQLVTVRYWRLSPMADPRSIQGELQVRIMAALWQIEQGTVEQVRVALPAAHRGAYTTVQTVLNRLADRGLLSRTKDGNALVYRPTLTEGDYVSESIERALAGASSEARQVALAQLVGNIDGVELRGLKRLAKEIDRRRATPQ